jgi:hypothetical protein
VAKRIILTKNVWNKNCSFGPLWPFGTIQNSRTPKKCAPDFQAGVEINNFSGSVLLQITNSSIHEFPLLNELVTQTVAMETWAAFHSSEGSARGRNPLGVKMFESSGFTSKSRATAAGKLTDRASSSNTLVSSGLGVWNTCSDLRTATTKGAARRAANSFALGAPLWGCRRE